ncbi:MAG: hypothetical protein LBU70_10670 [Chitinispirillales bacterium]|jgi:hypothetical protein|nr:hypothetical protein [Chitinispirillales bacterium]
MDINFHYFAVKTIAKEAGFDEAEAQQVATYSQYVDDFNWIRYIDCKNIPDYIKDDSACDLYVSSPLTLNLNFNPLTTGFGTASMVFLLLERSQKFTVSPFHFVPTEITDNLKEKRTVPAEVGDGSFIGNMLIDAREKLSSGKEDRKISLMRIGMMLHTFADTYAHQLFSGYNSWVNDIKIVSVTDNINNTDVTETVLEQIDQNIAGIKEEIANINEDIVGVDRSILPYIGHMWALNTPDRSNLSFKMKYKASKDDNYTMEHARSNTQTFLIAARHILDYLRSCRGQGSISDGDWAIFAEKLQKGFLVKYPPKNVKIRELAEHWRKFFPENQYAYNEKSVEKEFYGISADSALGDTLDNSIIGKNYTETFYRYNYIADTSLIKMYGPLPRKAWFN